MHLGCIPTNRRTAGRPNDGESYPSGRTYTRICREWQDRMDAKAWHKADKEAATIRNSAQRRPRSGRVMLTPGEPTEERRLPGILQHPREHPGGCAVSRNSGRIFSPRPYRPATILLPLAADALPTDSTPSGVRPSLTPIPAWRLPTVGLCRVNITRPLCGRHRTKRQESHRQVGMHPRCIHPTAPRCAKRGCTWGASLQIGGPPAGRMMEKAILPAGPIRACIGSGKTVWTQKPGIKRTRKRRPGETPGGGDRGAVG